MKHTLIFIICVPIMFYLEVNKANFILSTNPMEAVLGETFSFVCKIGSTQVEFRKDTKPFCIIIGHYSNQTCNKPGNYNTNFTYICNASTYTVTIPGLYLTEKLHGTEWECLNVNNNSQRSGKYKLNVTVPITAVTISTTPDENPVEVIKDHNREFTCRTSEGRPSSRIQWFLSNDNITSSATGTSTICATDCSDGKQISSSTIIYRGQKNDSMKTIYCKASNVEGHGVTSVDKILDVLYSPTTPSITQIPESIINEHENITLICRVKGGNPKATIAWQCDGSIQVDSNEIPVSNDTAISSIQLIATKERNGQECKCTGTHPAWTQTNYSSLILDIRYAPDLPSIKQIPTGPIIEGNQVVLTCEISGGKPLATITWICDGFASITPTVAPSTKKVVSSIEHNVSKADDGKECICRGNHPLWTQQKEERHTLIVYYPPIRNPLITQTPNGSVDEGTAITLACDIPGGKPLANITWQCNGVSAFIPIDRPSSGVSISVVHLNVTKHQHGMQCTCFGFHPAWIPERSNSIQLDVRYPPETLQPIWQTPNGPIIEGNRVNLTCEIIGGNPLPTIEWECDSFLPTVPIVSPQTLKVVSSVEWMATKEDNGKRCTCTGHHSLWGTAKRANHTLNIYYSTTVQISNTKPITVVENNSVALLCSEIDGNPRNASFIWYKSSDVIWRTANYSIIEVNAQDAGYYTCEGSNGFGNKSEALIEVHVLYSPKILAVSALYGSTIAENGTTVLQCSVKSNPPPDIVWMKNGRNVQFHSNMNLFESNITIESGSCFDTGNYTCKVTNIINNEEYTIVKSIEIFVSCSPRRYNQHDGSTNLIGLAVGQNLTISEHVLSYPIGVISWNFKQDRNSSKTEIHSALNCSTYNIFDHHICYSRFNLTENDFGVYSAVVENEIGNYTFTYTVNPQGRPYKSTTVNVTCGTLKAEVRWITGFNGGQQQTFFIITTDKDGVQIIHRTGIVGNEKDLPKRYTLTMPAGPFHFDVFGNNTFGNATVQGSFCKVQGLEENDSVLGLAAGLGSSMAIVLIVIVAGVIFFRKRISKKNADDPSLFKRSDSTANEDSDDALTENPLYVTSEIHHDGENGQVYSRVNKTKKRGLEEPVSFDVNPNGPVYSEVNKIGKKGKTSTELEMGNLYGNADNILRDNNEDGVYANANNTSKSSNKLYISRKNKDGLIYADLELDNCPTGRKFVIRGLENRTNYAIIDLNVKVDPLPSDDDDNEEGDQEPNTDNGQNN